MEHRIVKAWCHGYHPVNTRKDAGTQTAPNTQVAAAAAEDKLSEVWVAEGRETVAEGRETVAEGTVRRQAAVVAGTSRRSTGTAPAPSSRWPSG